MTTARQNWLDTLSWQVEFYGAAAERRRTDSEFAWPWFEAGERAKGRRGDALRNLVKHAVRRLPIQTRWHQAPYSLGWLRAHTEQLWEARTLIEDDLSKLLFDTHLLLRAVGHRRFLFPRIDYVDYVKVLGDKAFDVAGFQSDYVGLPLRVFEIEIPERSDVPRLKVISTHLQMGLINTHRQYLVRRGQTEVAPRPNEVVFDCGACVGDISLLFAGLVGARGEVHLFDPVPLHARYCELQAAMNPEIGGAFRMNVVAVAETSRDSTTEKVDIDRIAPGGLAIESFATTSLDDYVERNSLGRVDLIKMDIEGAEMAALRGGRKAIARHTPRLTISAYHKPHDLWEIPLLIKGIDPQYRLFFGHHSPTQWESVFYAVNPNHRSP